MGFISQLQSQYDHYRFPFFIHSTKHKTAVCQTNFPYVGHNIGLSAKSLFLVSQLRETGSDSFFSNVDITSFGMIDMG